MNEPLTFKRLCDAAVTTGEMSHGTADYFLGLYANSDEARDLESLREDYRRLWQSVADLSHPNFKGLLADKIRLDWIERHCLSLKVEARDEKSFFNIPADREHIDECAAEQASGHH